MILLNGVTADTVGTRQKCVGPTTLAIESTSFGGGTVTIYAARTLTSPLVAIGTFTASAFRHLSLEGIIYISATLAGSTTPSALTVSTLTNGV